MAKIITNKKIDKTRTYNGILELDDGTDEHQMKFVQGIKITIDDSALERDFVDDGAPEFTRIGDVLGTFSYQLKDTISLFAASTPATDEETLSFWMEKLADEDPAVLSFITTVNAPKSTGNKFGRIKFVGRIMKTDWERVKEQGIEDVTVEGEITSLTSILRTAS